MFESNFEERLKGLDAGAEMATFDCFTAVDVFGDKEILVITTPSRCEAMAKRFRSAASSRSGRCSTPPTSSRTSRG
jgi:hypothetical protein